MAGATDQKLRLLYLMRFLLRQTDERHPAGIADMLGELESYGITANRKTLYDDMEALKVFGLDIVTSRTHTTGYYVASREFELPELKLLVDSVQSSKFITQKKTLSLIRKIEGLTSVHEGRLLQRQVYVHNRVKTMNESVYYNVDELSGAISSDRAIRFRYFEYAPDGSRIFRRGGGWYSVSPFALMWDDENYYLLGWDEDVKALRHYRVDKMERITARPEARQGKEAFADVDMSSYTTRVFGMFGGEAQPVRMRFARHLAGAVIDRFGRGVLLVPEAPPEAAGSSDGVPEAPSGSETFLLTAQVVVSPQFYAWLLGFGDEAELIGPTAVREGLRRHLWDTLRLYGDSAPAADTHS